MLFRSGTSKDYQIIVTGESLGKPFATVSAGKGAGKVTLEERFEEIEGGDRDFNGDFIIDDSSENVIFNGYFGKAMLSEIKTIKGKEYLDVTISSELIDNFYFDADFKNLINDGLNTLEVFETEDEQPTIETISSSRFLELPCFTNAVSSTYKTYSIFFSPQKL